MVQLVFLLISLWSSAHAQDERFYRQIIGGQLPELNKGTVELASSQFNVGGSSYHVDLNGDGIEEILCPQKRDGVDWLEIRDTSQRVIFEAKLLALGSESVLYKIKLVNLSLVTKALILYLDEGKTHGKKFESSGRIFVISIDNNDLKSMVLTQGPHFFHEKEGQREQYWRRDYNLNVYDVDKDGIREISVQYHHIQRFMKYLGNGMWLRF
jgi:hypothetical protein